MYVYIDSDQCLQYFPENQSASFRIRLPKQLKFPGSWEVALVEIDLPRIKNSPDPQYLTVNSPICTENFVNTGLRPILRRIYKRQLKQDKHIAFYPLMYVPVNTERLEVLQIYITDDVLQTPSFQAGTLYCTLHFRQRRS